MRAQFKRMVFVGVVMLMAACGGGGDGSVSIPVTPQPTAGTVTGKVVNNEDGTAIAAATVALGTASTTTAADGSYTLANIPAGANKVVSITKANFAPGSKITTVTAGATSQVDVALLPVAYTATFDPTAAQTLTATGSTAQVSLGANALVTAAGTAPTGPVTVNITPVDPTSNPQIMPGNYTTSAGGIMESFGAMEVNFAAGSTPLNLASGQTATIRIPVAAGATAPPASMPAFFYNTTTGQWVQEGTLTLAGTAPNQYYTGTVTHFSYWNADQVYNTTCITGRVVNAANVPVAGARVEAQGRNYIGTSEAYTAADGTFTILVKASSSVIVSASTSDALSQSIIFSTGAAGSVCTALPEDLKLGAPIGSAGSGSAKIKLTWGTNPSDLDSHLTGPTGAVGTRFHVYFGDQGTLTASPFAALDVDDTTSFGPEVITISSLVAGTYRYSVHQFSGSGTIDTSPARVELLLNGVTRVFTPPNPSPTIIGDDSVWVVFELVVSTTGVVVTPVNSYLTGVGASAVQKPVADTFDEYYLYRNLPKK